MAVDPMFRRSAAVALAAFGAFLMLAAPDSMPGVAVLALAVGIEVVGILINRER